ncbi:hypothetical protein KR50_06960 [Jeotgalibacillus campisalis]|uniref:Uncharacterized protein n=1 Tax=Jeotgalibacillus campisalis TaxID=220754 RepID=A0A0C2VS73_9BACL|nr:hypothetical protein KR50_06960 [Jeotgalibacillus campisalis]
MISSSGIRLCSDQPGGIRRKLDAPPPRQLPKLIRAVLALF